MQKEVTIVKTSALGITDIAQELATMGKTDIVQMRALLHKEPPEKVFKNEGLLQMEKKLDVPIESGEPIRAFGTETPVYTAPLRVRFGSTLNKAQRDKRKAKNKQARKSRKRGK